MNSSASDLIREKVQREIEQLERLLHLSGNTDERLRQILTRDLKNVLRAKDTAYAQRWVFRLSLHCVNVLSKHGIQSDKLALIIDAAHDVAESITTTWWQNDEFSEDDMPSLMRRCLRPECSMGYLVLLYTISSLFNYFLSVALTKSVDPSSYQFTTSTLALLGTLLTLILSYTNLSARFSSNANRNCITLRRINYVPCNDDISCNTDLRYVGLQRDFQPATTMRRAWLYFEMAGLDPLKVDTIFSDGSTLLLERDPRWLKSCFFLQPSKIDGSGLT